MQRTALIVSALTIVTGMVLACAGVAAAARTSQSVRLTALDSTLLVQINVLRQAHQLSPLQLSRQLNVAANQHSSEMAQAGYFAHPSLDNTAPDTRIERSYPSRGHRSWSVGENLLYVSPDVTAAEAITAWMNSPAHKANLLDPSWREIGISARHTTNAPGIYNNQPVTIITTDFGARR